MKMSHFYLASKNEMYFPFKNFVKIKINSYKYSSTSFPFFFSFEGFKEFYRKISILKMYTPSLYRGKSNVLEKYNNNMQTN